jgi:hypothetical protein
MCLELQATWLQDAIEGQLFGFGVALVKKLPATVLKNVGSCGSYALCAQLFIPRCAV